MAVPLQPQSQPLHCALSPSHHELYKDAPQLVSKCIYYLSRISIVQLLDTYLESHWPNSLKSLRPIGRELFGHVVHAVQSSHADLSPCHPMQALHVLPCRPLLIRSCCPICLINRNDIFDQSSLGKRSNRASQQVRVLQSNPPFIQIGQRLVRQST